jgi:hypothetical protein
MKEKRETFMNEKERGELLLLIVVCEVMNFFWVAGKSMVGEGEGEVEEER